MGTQRKHQLKKFKWCAHSAIPWLDSFQSGLHSSPPPSIPPQVSVGGREGRKGGCQNVMNDGQRGSRCSSTGTSKPGCPKPPQKWTLKWQPPTSILTLKKESKEIIWNTNNFFFYIKWYSAVTSQIKVCITLQKQLNQPEDKQRPDRPRLSFALPLHGAPM